MKIAICFFGQPRNVDNGFFHFNKHILEKYEVDVYAHLWNSNSSELDKFLSNYKPKKYIIEDQIDFDMSKYKDIYGIQLIHSQAFDKPYTFNSISQCYSYKKANDIILNSLVNYDLIIKARTDTSLNKFDLNLNTIDTSVYNVPSVPSGFMYNDVIAICNQSISNIISSRYEKLDSWYKSGIRDFIPESLILRVLLENNISINRDQNLHADIIK